MQPETRDRPGVEERPTLETEREVGQLLLLLRRLERGLDELRGLLEANARVQRHREFSFARLAGAVLQALVVGLLMLALSDWFFQADVGQLLVKLALAGVLQLATLTAFILARDAR